MTDRIIVINPNSSEGVTDDIDTALTDLRADANAAFECLTLAEGPPGIETQRHVDSVVMPMCRLIESCDNRASAYVVACFSDPGLHAARETTRKPVLGIAESGFLTAMTLGDRVGLIGILPTSIARHTRYIRALGIEDRYAGELAVGLGVTDLADESVTLSRMTEPGRRLADEKGADVIVMGCAGMARYRTRLEDDLGIPVIDPTQAAAGMAITASRLGYRTKGQRAH
jgi:Asp/Glu/hydantoin racemase